MALTKAQVVKILQLASEGKQIMLIHSEYFPTLSYREVHAEIGGKNALGVQRMITGRLNKLHSATSMQDRRALISQVKNLTRIMYENHKMSHTKIDKVRKALGA